MNKRHLAQFGVVLSVVLCASSAWGDYVQRTDFTGSWPTTSTGYTVNFAVYERDSGGGTWSFGTQNNLDGTLDADAPYVYLYELCVGNGREIAKFTVPGAYTSMGYIFGPAKPLIFNDGQSVLPDHALGKEATPLSFEEGPEWPPFYGAMVYGGSLDYPDNAQFSFTDLGEEAYSAVLYLTSDFGPTWTEDGTLDAGTGGLLTISGENVNGASGIPSAVPEPTTMLLSAVGLSVFGGLGFLRRRNKKESSPSA